MQVLDSRFTTTMAVEMQVERDTGVPKLRSCVWSTMPRPCRLVTFFLAFTCLAAVNAASDKDLLDPGGRSGYTPNRADIEGDDGLMVVRSAGRALLHSNAARKGWEWQERSRGGLIGGRKSEFNHRRELLLTAANHTALAPTPPMG